jgi:hypothetical protein
VNPPGLVDSPAPARPAEPAKTLPPARLTRVFTAAERPARRIAFALSLAGIVVLVGLGIDWLELPGWPFVGGVAAVCVALAVRSPLARLSGWVAGKWGDLLDSRSKPLRLAVDAVEIVRVVVRLALPLAFLPLVIVTFAARGYSIGIQVAVGAVAMLVALLALWAERGREKDIWAWVRRRPVRFLATFVVVCALVPLGLALAASQTGIGGALKGIGGWVTVSAIGALAIWVVAAGLRILRFATSPIRLLGLPLIALAAARALIEVGVLPGEHLAGDVDGFLVGGGWAWFGIFLVGFGILVVTHPLHQQLTGEHTTWRHVARVLGTIGFAAAAFSALILFVTVCWALNEAGPAGSSLADASRRPETPAMPGWTRLPQSDVVLARKFAPILELDARERWPLSSVDEYLTHVELFRSGASAGKTDEPTLPTTCPTGTALIDCYTLSCPEASGSCVAGHAVGSGSGVAGTEYARVYRRDRRSDSAAFIPPVRIGHQYVSAIVEYWLFYDYDRWRAATALGVLTQQHEGDWESVTVGLANEGPVFVAYSAHCGGSWYPWPHVEARTADLLPHDNRPETQALHPLVAVALGSHANYAQAAGRRASGWETCKKVPREAAAALSYTWNIRDRTSPDYELRPAKVELVRDFTGPTSFAGRWGRSDTIVLTNERRRQISSGPGPTSPFFKDLWTTPSWTIFHTSAWRQGS